MIAVVRAAAIVAVLLSGGCKSPVLMTKPGVSQAQADRDTKRCEAQADKAMKDQVRSARDQAQAHNRVLLGCMRAMGYEIKGPAPD